MTTKAPSSLFLVFCASTSFALAQATTPPAADGNAPTGEKKERSISKETSAALSAGFTYQPVTEPVKSPELEEEEVDERDVDKPRNEIIRLPKYMVEEQRPPVFSQHNFYPDAKARSQWMLRRYFGSNTLNQFQLGKAGEMYASQAFWDDQRLKGMTEGNRQVSLYREAGDEERAEKAKEEMRSSYIRVQDPTTTDLSKWAGQRY